MNLADNAEVCINRGSVWAKPTLRNSRYFWIHIIAVQLTLIGEVILHEDVMLILEGHEGKYFVERSCFHRSHSGRMVSEHCLHDSTTASMSQLSRKGGALDRRLSFGMYLPER